jgi:uncharacterized protein YukE
MTDRDPMTGDPVPAGRRPVRSRRRRRQGLRADQAVRLMYATAYLLDAPSTQQLLVWGGAEARQLAGHAAGLVAEQQWLSAAAGAWRAAAGDLQQAADELTGPAATLDGWQSAAAGAFRAGQLATRERLGALAQAYGAVGDTLAGTADDAGRVHAALLTSMQAAGEAVRLLAGGVGPGAAAQAVVAAWLRSCRVLHAAWADRADQAAARLTALVSSVNSLTRQVAEAPITLTR